MGFTPAEVGQMTPWEFMACLEGYGRSQGWDMAPKGKALSIDRLRQLGIEGFD